MRQDHAMDVWKCVQKCVVMVFVDEKFLSVLARNLGCDLNYDYNIALTLLKASHPSTNSVTDDLIRAAID
jgi:hypothetical protein